MEEFQSMISYVSLGQHAIHACVLLLSISSKLDHYYVSFLATVLSSKATGVYILLHGKFTSQDM